MRLFAGCRGARSLNCDSWDYGDWDDGRGKSARGESPSPRVGYGRRGRSPHLNLPPRWGKRGSQPARPPLDWGQFLRTGIRPRNDGCTGVLPLFSYRNRRLWLGERPAHKGMKVAGTTVMSPSLCRRKPESRGRGDWIPDFSGTTAMLRGVDPARRPSGFLRGNDDWGSRNDEGVALTPYQVRGRLSVLCRRGRGGGSPHLNLSPQMGEEGDPGQPGPVSSTGQAFQPESLWPGEGHIRG